MQPTSCLNPVRRSRAGLAVDGPSVKDVEDPAEDPKGWCVVDFGTLSLSMSMGTACTGQAAYIATWASYLEPWGVGDANLKGGVYVNKGLGLGFNLDS